MKNNVFVCGAKKNFPDKIRVRDTGFYDDLGGMGQRILTTAGQGYEKITYVREDRIIERIAFLENMLEEIESMLSGPLTGEDARNVATYLDENDWKQKP